MFAGSPQQAPAGRLVVLTSDLFIIALQMAMFYLSEQHLPRPSASRASAAASAALRRMEGAGFAGEASDPSHVEDDDDDDHDAGDLADGELLSGGLPKALLASER